MEGTGSLSRADLEGVLGFVSAIEECEDVQSLRDHLLRELRALVPADSVTYTEIDGLSGEAAWWTDPPEVGHSADPEPFVEFLDQHPVAAYHERNGGAKAVQFADFLTRRELHRLDIYNEFYRPLDVEHQLAIAVDAPRAVTIPISVQRKRSAFPATARAIMELLHPHLSRAYRQLAARADAEGLLLAVGQARGAALIVLGPNDRIELATGPAMSWLGGYFDQPGEAADDLPRDLAAWLSETRIRLGRDRAGGEVAGELVLRRPGAQLALRYLPATSRWEHDHLLLEERRERPDPDELREWGLTRREAEVLFCAAGGNTDAQIAAELFLSPRTVQKHLQSVYRKLDVQTRTAAVSRALARPLRD